jgi:CheY-like chemotaxis protein
MSVVSFGVESITNCTTEVQILRCISNHFYRANAVILSLTISRRGGTKFDKKNWIVFLGWRHHHMSKATALVVEDDPDTLEVIKILLEEGGFKVKTATDCSKASTFLMSYPDIILTDLMTPQMTGLEFIYQTRRVSNFDRIPIIAMTAYDKTYLAAAIMAGADAALHKPVDLDKLVETANQMLAKRYKGEVASAGAGTSQDPSDTTR